MSLNIGPYVVDVKTGHVTKEGVAMKWGSKTTQLFCLLLENAPKTINKEKIFAQVWKGRVVTENTLYKTISKLRQELNQDGIEIESMFGEGYRITTNVSPTQQVKSRPGKHRLIQTVLIAGFMLWISMAGYHWMNQKQLVAQMLSLDKHLAVTKQAFISQINRRNELGELLSQRFELSQADSWEKRFYQLHEQMNEQELFLCQQTRAYTEGPMLENNLAVLTLLNDNPKLAATLPLAQQMISHLTLWLNKHDRVFKNSEKMCLLYVGVEDGAKYPADFDQQVKNWLVENQ